MGGQSGGGGGEKVQQIDPLRLMLSHSGKGGEVDEQQRPAPYPKGGQYPGGGSGEKSEKQTPAVRALQAP